MKLWVKYIIWSSLILTSFDSFAQTFGGNWQNKKTTKDELISDSKLEEVLNKEKDELSEINQQEAAFVPGGGLDVMLIPTDDGSKRGGAAVVELDKDGNSRRAEKIFLYYDNFNISGYLNNSPSCDVRFFVLTNLNKKLIQLDVKLVWPDLTTALSFSDIAPNTPTYIDYTLMGKGCYNMDKMPNIVVNRCRVRGMSSVDCANKIIWLKTKK